MRAILEAPHPFTEQYMDTLMQLGVGGIFAILVIREVLNFLRGRTTEMGSVIPGSCLTPEEHKLIRQRHEWSRDLHNWHNVSDEEGVKIWYVRKSLEDVVDRLATTIEKLSEVQRAEFDVLKEMARDMRDLRDSSKN
jgi:hypothetical protein